MEEEEEVTRGLPVGYPRSRGVESDAEGGRRVLGWWRETVRGVMYCPCR